MRILSIFNYDEKSKRFFYARKNERKRRKTNTVHFKLYCSDCYVSFLKGGLLSPRHGTRPSDLEEENSETRFSP